MSTKNTVSTDEQSRARRIANFGVRAEASREPDFPGEKTIYVTYNGRQEYPTALAPHEAAQVHALLGAVFGLDAGMPPATLIGAEDVKDLAQARRLVTQLRSRVRDLEHASEVDQLEWLARAKAVDALPRHTYASIANNLVGKLRDGSNTEYVALADVRALFLSPESKP